MSLKPPMQQHTEPNRKPQLVHQVLQNSKVFLKQNKKNNFCSVKSRFTHFDFQTGVDAMNRKYETNII